MLLDEIITTVKQTLTERITSPLLGGFLVSWCLWNWRFLVILFSDATVSQTFEMVDRVAFPTTTAVITRGFFFPLATAAAYIFVYPFPARFVYWYSLRRQRETNETKQRHADETLLSVEDSRLLRAEYVERERKNTDLIQIRNNEIARLTAALDAAEKVGPMPLLRAAVEKDKSLTEAQAFLLTLLEKLGSPAPESVLIERSTQGKIPAEFNIGELERLKLLKRNYDISESQYTLAFTHEGRKALLETKAHVSPLTD
jgi:hypothetical protein